METIDVVVIGAGVTGLASARAIALTGKSVCVLERHPRPGLDTSTHNSGVIHAGLYYPTQSLKARLSVEGRRLLYEFAATHGVAHERCGKFVIAHDEHDMELLERYGTDPLSTYLVNEREVWFVPCVNPDGYVYNQTTNPGGGGLWRKNRRANAGGSTGVDLNRNYAHQWGFDDEGSSPFGSDETFRGSAPASEPETAAMQAFIGAHTFATSMSAHTYSDLWLWPWGYTAAGPANNAQYSEIGLRPSICCG